MLLNTNLTETTTMDAQKLVPTRETCQRLKEAGWTTKTYFLYDGRDDFELCGDIHPDYWHESDLPAPTPAELLDALPTALAEEWGEDKPGWMMYSFGGAMSIEPYEYPGYNSVAQLRREYLSQQGRNGAEAAALLWLKLQDAHAGAQTERM